MTHQSYVRHIMSKSRKETKEDLSESIKNASETNVKSCHYTHIKQPGSKITLRMKKDNCQLNLKITVSKVQMKHLLK